jgi:hypothetical protein
MDYAWYSKNRGKFIRWYIPNRPIDLLIAFFISVITVTGGIYSIPSLFELSDSILFTKRVIFCLLFVFIFLSQKYNYKIFFRQRIVIVFLAYIGLLLLNGLIRRDNYGEYLYRITTIASIISIMYWFAFIDDNTLDKFFKIINFMVLLLCMFLLLSIALIYLGDGAFYQSFITGFGGGRTNFSCWLGLITCVVGLGLARDEKYILKSFAIFFVIVTSQIISGGRLGIILSYCSIIIAFPLKHTTFSQKIKISIIFLFFLVLPLLVNKTLSIAQPIRAAESIFRRIDNSHLIESSNKPLESSNKPLNMHNYGSSIYYYVCNTLNYNYFTYFDELSGSRLTLSEIAISKLDNDHIWLGRGIGNFLLVMDNRTLNEHNLYIRTLGEIGLIGILITIIMVLFPFFIRPIDDVASSYNQYLIIGIVFSSMQPNTLVMGIDVCLSYWILYSMVFRNSVLAPEFRIPRWLR